MPNCNAKIAIFTASSAGPVRSAKYKFAAELVKSGRAEFIDSRSIRLLEKKIIAVSSTQLRSRQGQVYQSSVADSNPQFFQGGLTRAEHQPAALSPYQGAKVGHQ